MRNRALFLVAGLAGCGAMTDGDGMEKPLLAVAGSPAQPAGCMAGETPIFRCTTSMGTRVAVCTAGPGDATFRADFPAAVRSGSDAVQQELTGGRWASVPYSGGGEAQIMFRDGTTRYIVYSRMVRTNFTAGEPNNPKITDGLVTIRSEGIVEVDTCRDDDDTLLPVQYDAAAKAMRDEGELFLD